MGSHVRRWLGQPGLIALIHGLQARPYLIFSITPLNAKLRQVGVVPLSTSAKVLPPVVVGVPSVGPNSVALCHQVRTIDKLRIGKYLGEISATDMTAIEGAVRQVYGL